MLSIGDSLDSFFRQTGEYTLLYFIGIYNNGHKPVNVNAFCYFVFLGITLLSKVCENAEDVAVFDEVCERLFLHQFAMNKNCNYDKFVVTLYSKCLAHILPD